MSLEIERKFLVNSDKFKYLAKDQKLICQGYLSRNPERTVRVRTCNDEGFITVKGLTRGCERVEYEYKIPFEEARQLLEMCEIPIIKKVRYIVDFADHIWEVDEFCEALSPLVVAEIELKSCDEKFEIPDFIGEEVTADPRYYNSNLMKKDIN